MAVVVSRRGAIFAVIFGGAWALGGCAAAPPGRVAGGAAGAGTRVMGDGTRVQRDARADGEVIRVDKAGGEIYINLTKRDHLRTGTVFECYDGRLGARPKDLKGEPAPGIATLEVTQVGEEFSICRIVRATSLDMAEGDPLMGRDFFPHYVFHFTLYGDFDLNGDGAATADERERLETLVRSWGGVIDRAVTVRTDYLVLGTRPASPAFKPLPEVVKGDVVDERTAEQKRYDGLLEEARRYAIPVYNQNRLLGMIGFYDTVVARE
jgi:hypothetical protein